MNYSASTLTKMTELIDDVANPIIVLPMPKALVLASGYCIGQSLRGDVVNNNK